MLVQALRLERVPQMLGLALQEQMPKVLAQLEQELLQAMVRQVDSPSRWMALS